jgi:hypothetical protein
MRDHRQDRAGHTHRSARSRKQSHAQADGWIYAHPLQSMDVWCVHAVQAALAAITYTIQIHTDVKGVKAQGPSRPPAQLHTTSSQLISQCFDYSSINVY